MTHTCSSQTDLQELIGSEVWEGQQLLFHDGPLVQAMREGDELILENSRALSVFTIAKLAFMRDSLFIDDTSELIQPHAGFRVTLK
ncbi:MAG: hypothetical protein V5B33_18840 [Candidatus Accumulibacter sp. UW20]|jgi:midasin (ATPase involved in ribosome maturation)